MPHRKRSLFDWPSLATNIVYGVLAFAGASLLRGFWLAGDLASKPWVNDQLVQQKIYVDERDKQIAKESFEHSDANRQAMMLRMEQFNTETKAAQTAVQVKVELILDAIRDIRDQSQRPRK